MNVVARQGLAKSPGGVFGSLFCLTVASTVWSRRIRAAKASRVQKRTVADRKAGLKHVGSLGLMNDAYVGLANRGSLVKGAREVQAQSIIL